MLKAVVATKNKHKVKELNTLLSKFIDAELITAHEAGFDKEIDENGKTFAENAYIKAHETAKALNMPAIADDSGLTVDFLNGEPGIFSARYASKNGENSSDAANIEKLLSKLSGVHEKQRGGGFVCAMCLCFPDGTHIDAEGICRGRILTEIKGNGGFGYDPIFYYEPLLKTFGELSEEEKNSVSHRALAVEELCKKIKNERLK